MICATPLATVGAEPPREERRVVSILFADLVGFTARSDRADPEDVRGTLVPFHRIAKEEIERHGGTLDKFIGDAAMGVFGVPAVHEDDPERAVRAALAIQARAEEFAQANPGRELHVRVAVETGEAVVTLATGPQIGENVVGDVVNTASRLQGVAPAGGVVVGEGAHRSVRSRVEATELEPVTVKGKAEPLRVWRVDAVVAPAGAGRDAADGGPFVGRRAELHAIERLWTDVLESGSVRGAVLVGEPGIGKSRLLAEARVRLAGDPEWLRGMCPPYGEAATFRAFAEVVRGHAGIAEGDPPDSARLALATSVERMVSEQADRAWLLARLGPLVAPGSEGGDGAHAAPADREELFGACERYLRAASAAGPVVVVLEDLHFAEPAMTALALHLTRALAGAAVLLLCTTREELFDRDEGWREAGGRPDGPAVLRMGRLSDDEVRRLVAGLAADAVGGETERVLVDRAGGNPLFARELVRMLEERSAESDGDGEGEADGKGGRADAGRDGVPDTVQAVVAARLDVLPPGRRSLVQTAAVVGDAFWPGAVAAVAGEEPAAVADALDSLVERGLVREQQSTLAGEREFSFTHAVIRDVAYGQIPRRNRADRHVAVARWLEEALGERADARAEGLANHYRVAVDLTRAAGDEPGGEVVASARRFLVLAGERSASLDAVRATEYLLQALELAPAGDPDRAPILVSAARFGRRSGRLTGDEVVRMLEEATALFLDRDDRAGAGEACLRLGMQLGARGQGERARSALGRGLALLEGAPGAERELALAYATLGEDAALGARFAEALDWSERAIALPGSDETTIMALQVRGDARCSTGDLDGVEDIRRSVDMALREGLAQDAAVAHSWLAEWRWLLEGPAAGIEEERKGQDLGERRGLTGATMWSRTAQLGMLFDLGRWDELLEHAGELLARGRAGRGDADHRPRPGGDHAGAGASRASPRGARSASTRWWTPLERRRTSSSSSRHCRRGRWPGRRPASRPPPSRCHPSSTVGRRGARPSTASSTGRRSCGPASTRATPAGRAPGRRDGRRVAPPGGRRAHGRGARGRRRRPARRSAAPRSRRSPNGGAGRASWSRRPSRRSAPRRPRARSGATTTRATAPRRPRRASVPSPRPPSPSAPKRSPAVRQGADAGRRNAVRA